MNAAMEDRTTIEWDKDDLDALGMLKIDVLALGMLTALAKGFALLDKHYGETLTLSTLPPEEACVYAMIQRADTIGVFQIESRAQMSMLPRLKPEKFYDLVIEVAIVRPGPDPGRHGASLSAPPAGAGARSSSLRRELEAVLGKTLGVPLFQEQAMKIAIVAGLHAGRGRQAAPGDGDVPPRRHDPDLSRPRWSQGMAAKGYDREFAERCFRQIEGFGEYGFPESHAASFALLVYASCWMKCRYPDVFLAAMLNAQPLGFYAPAQLVRDAREHGVEVREVDVNFSDWDCDAGGDDAAAFSRLREKVGRRADEGTADAWRGPLSGALAPTLSRKGREGDGHFTPATPPWPSTSAPRTPSGSACARSSARARRRCASSSSGAATATIPCAISGCAAAFRSPALEKLADADAFRSLGLDRREALWAVKRAEPRRRPGRPAAVRRRRGPSARAEPDAKLPPMPLGAHVVEDYRRLSLSLKAHPVAFMRARLAARGILRSDALDATKSGARVTVAGLVLVRQRPGTAKGVIFMTLEDEAGVANIIVWPKAFERLRAIVIGARFVAVTGKLQNEAGVIHIIAERMEDLDADARPALRRGARDRDARPRRRGPPPADARLKEAAGQPLRASAAVRRTSALPSPPLSSEERKSPARCRRGEIFNKDRLRGRFVHNNGSSLSECPLVAPAATHLIDVRAQHRVDLGLIAASFAPEEFKHVTIDAHVEHSFQLRGLDGCARPIDDKARFVRIGRDRRLDLLRGCGAGASPVAATLRRARAWPRFPQPNN